VASPVRVDDREGGVRVLTLARPPANALDDHMLVALDSAVAAADRDDAVRALLIRAEGAFFCGGFDLRAPRRTGERVREMVELYRDSHRRLLSIPKPTIAVVQGHAVAGGLVLALACDHRFAATGDYRVGLNETAIGAAFPPVAFEIVRLRLTHAACTELLLGAETSGAEMLVRLGVVRELSPPNALEDVALACARRLAAHPRELYAHTKRALVADALARIDAVSSATELEIAALWSTDESRAARAAQRRRL
jgi:enoyl-CoA hydratase